MDGTQDSVHHGGQGRDVQEDEGSDGQHDDIQVEEGVQQDECRNERHWL